MNREELYYKISNKVLENSKEKILNEILKKTLSTICMIIEKNNIKIENKKEFNSKYLNNTIELIFNDLKQKNNELFSNNLISNVKQSNAKQKTTNNIKNIFCTKNKIKDTPPSPKSKTSENKIKLNQINLYIPSVVYFCKNIPNSIEIPRKIFNANFTLQKNINKYHYFTVKLNHNNKSYYITYAELNKFTKREIIAIYFNNEQIFENEFPYELKEEYDFY